MAKSKMKRMCCFCRKEVPLGGADTFKIKVGEPANDDWDEGFNVLLWCHGDCMHDGIPTFLKRKRTVKAPS